jgi:hypothetical protein
MNNKNFMVDEIFSHPNYDAPRMDIIEINVEQGFALSSDGFGLGDGTSYDEEDVEW